MSWTIFGKLILSASEQDSGGRQVVIADVRDPEANAKLISAAPDLYEAVRVCVNVCSKALQGPVNLNGRTPYDIAMAALAKARGEA